MWLVSLTPGLGLHKHLGGKKVNAGIVTNVRESSYIAMSDKHTQAGSGSKGESMAGPSRLILYQEHDLENHTDRRSVEVTLLPRRSPMPNDFRTNKDLKDWAVMLSKYSDHGRWILEVNSVTCRVDSTYTIGTSAPQNEKCWGFSPSRRELDFFEQHTMTTAGPFGETEVVDVVTVTLYEAWYGTNGLILSTGAVGNGFVRTPSNILRPGLVRWERLVS